MLTCCFKARATFFLAAALWADVCIIHRFFAPYSSIHVILVHYICADMQQTAALSPKEGEIASQAEARRDSAQEPTGETARLKSRNGNTGGELTWGRRLGPIICPEKTASKTPGEFPEDIEVDRVKGPVVPKSMSRPAKKNRRRRANRRFKEALHQNFTKEEKEDGEAVATPKIRAVQDSEGFLNSTNHASVNECVKQTTVSQTDTELPKWLRSTAQLIQMESTWGKQHEFYYGEELDAHEKIYCVLHSIDDSCLSHDGLERPVYPESWHEWEHLSSPCKGLGKIHQRAPKVKIHKIMYHGVDAEPATFYQTVDEHSNYHTFTADGTPVHTAQMLEWHERDFNQRCKSLTDFEALVNEQEVLIADSCGIKYGPDGNPIAETLSNLKYGGVVFRGKPRLVHSHVLLPNGRDNCGNIIRKYGYTKTLLAYKSFYRVMSTSNKEIYHFGGEQLFYKSGQPCAHLYGNPEPDANIFEELVYL